MTMNSIEQICFDFLVSLNDVNRLEFMKMSSFNKVIHLYTYNHTIFEVLSENGDMNDSVLDLLSGIGFWHCPEFSQIISTPAIVDYLLAKAGYSLYRVGQLPPQFITKDLVLNCLSKYICSSIRTAEMQFKYIPSNMIQNEEFMITMCSYNEIICKYLIECPTFPLFSDKLKTLITLKAS